MERRNEGMVEETKRGQALVMALPQSDNESTFHVEAGFLQDKKLVQ